MVRIKRGVIAAPSISTSTGPTSGRGKKRKLPKLYYWE